MCTLIIRILVILATDIYSVIIERGGEKASFVLTYLAVLDREPNLSPTYGTACLISKAKHEL